LSVVLKNRTTMLSPILHKYQPISIAHQAWNLCKEVLTSSQFCIVKINHTSHKRNSQSFHRPIYTTAGSKYQLRSYISVGSSVNTIKRKITYHSFSYYAPPPPPPTPSPVYRFWVTFLLLLSIRSFSRACFLAYWSVCAKGVCLFAYHVIPKRWIKETKMKIVILVCYS